MQNLTSLIKSLYQQFFTGKGSLSLELIFPNENTFKSGLEGWQLSVKKNSLVLRAESPFALAQSLSYLAQIPKSEIHLFLGMKKPYFSKRALLIKNEPLLSHEMVSQIIKAGFNTLIYSKDANLVSEYGLNVLNLYPLHEENFSRKLLYKDFVIQEIKKAANKSFIKLDHLSCFEEAHFESAKDQFFGFDETREAWEILRAQEFIHSNFLPVISLNKDLTLKDVKNKLENALGEMKINERGDKLLKGWVIEIDHWPSDHTLLNYAGMASLDPTFLRYP